MPSKLGGFHGVVNPRFAARLEKPVTSEPIAFFCETWGPSVTRSSSDGIEIVFCGELYGSSSAVDSRTAVDKLLQEYVAHGVDFAGALDGVYALALWDSRTRRFLVCRDSSAARSFYYYEDRQGCIHFSTQLRRLVEEAKPSLCRAGLWEYLRFLEIVPPNTLYEGVHALEAGHRLTFEVGKLDVRPIPVACDVYPKATDFDDAVSRLDELLQDAVRDRLAGTEDVGVFLSGGVDSALICALAKEAGWSPDEVVTVGFDEDRYDESRVAADIARHLHVPLQVLRFSDQDYLNAFDRLYAASDQPSADPAGLCTLLAFEYCQGRFSAMLDGSGAEALVGIMPARFSRLAIQYVARVPREVRGILAASLKRWPKLAGYARLFDFDDAEEILIRWRGFPRHELETLFGEPVSFAGTRFYGVFREYPPEAHFERYTALLGVLSDDRIHNAAALTGLAVRFPFLDRRTEGYVRTLPQSWRSTEAMEKRILRAALGRHLPVPLWDRPKHGFDFPLRRFLENENNALVCQHLDSAESPLLSIFDRAALQTYSSAFKAGDPDVLFRVWALVVLSKWLESSPLEGGNHYVLT